MTERVTMCILLCSMIISAGCATCDPVVVKVEVPVYAEPLPIPPPPEWLSPETDPANVNEYIRALAHDLISAWAWGTELKHVIKSHNKVISNEQP